MKKQKKNKFTPKQIAALTGVVLLVLLYIISLVTAVTDSSSSGTWFRASLFATVALPLFIWIYVWIYGKFTGKSTMADSPTEKSAKNHSPSSAQKDCASADDTNRSNPRQP